MFTNEELKVKFDDVNKKIETSRANNQDVSALLRIKYELLKMGFIQIKEKTSGNEFDKNPKKYSTLLSYINTMKEIANELKIPDNEIAKMEETVKFQMKENNLDWLLRQ